MRFWLVLLFVAEPFHSALIAQGLATPFLRLGQNEGLSQSSVLSIIQDRQGFMWFGSQNGLNRYDGQQFHVFHRIPEQPNSLCDNMIRQLYLDHQDRLWLLTFRGVMRLREDGSSFQRISDPNHPLLGSGSAICEDRNGDIWIQLEGEALCRIQANDQIESCNAGLPLEHGGFAVALLDSPELGMLAGVKGSSLFRWDTERKRFDPLPLQSRDGAPPSWGLSTLFRTKDGTHWLGFDNGTLYHFLPKEALLVRENFGILGTEEMGTIQALLEDDGLWVATSQAGLFRKFQGKWSNFRHTQGDPSSLPDDRIFSLFQDQGGLLWVGTNAGIARFNPAYQAFGHYRNEAQSNSISHNRIKSLFEDSQGRLWIGTFGGGLNQLDQTRSQVRRYSHNPKNPKGITSNNIFAIEAEGEKLWLGTWGGGLNLFDPETGTAKSYRAKPQTVGKLGTDSLISLYRDPIRDCLWIGTRERLERFDPKTEHFQPVGDVGTASAALLENSISAILPDGPSRLWICSFGAGLFEYFPESGAIQHFQHDPNRADSLSENRVTCVLRDKKNRLWVGTNGGSLNLQLTGDHFQKFGSEIGMPDDVVYAILEDASARLWLSSNHGLIRFEPETKSLRTFGPCHGLQDWEFNSHAYCKTANGELAFGGINGFNLFQPAAVRSNEHLPPVALTSFRKLHRDVAFAGLGSQVNPLRLTHRDYVITLGFTALDFADPKANQFAFRLEPLEKNWQYVGSQLSATYTNLAPGRYVFRVKAANNDGVWNEVGAPPFHIRVYPPLWRTWWAYSCYLLLLLALLVGGPFWWIRHLQLRRKELETLVEARTRDLSTANAELLETAARLKRTQQQLLAAAHLAGMSEIATSVMHNIGNLLNSANVSARLIHDALNGNRTLAFFRRVIELIKIHKHELANFLTQSEQGTQVPDALDRVYHQLHEAHLNLRSEVDQLSHSLDKIQQIIGAQEKYAQGPLFLEWVLFEQLLEEALLLGIDTRAEEKPQIVLHLEPLPMLQLAKTKLVQVLVNLLSNACDAIQKNTGPGQIEISTHLLGSDRLRIEMSDKGSGFEPSMAAQLFQLGFSTKPHGKGFGLHFCATSLAEMGGSIEAQSEGEGKGARFVIELPVKVGAHDSAHDSRFQP